MATKKVKAKAPVKVPFKGDDIMLDLETLDTDVTGAIIAIGAVRFNETEIDNDGFYRVIKIQSNLDEGRTISGNTLSWWMDQSDKAKAILSDPKAIPLTQALDEFAEWVGPPKHIRMWGNGADFDCSMVKHAYRSGQQDPPWVYWNTRCFRSIKDTAIGRKVQRVDPVVAHHAMHDALAQAQTLQAIWALEKELVK